MRDVSNTANAGSSKCILMKLIRYSHAIGAWLYSRLLPAMDQDEDLLQEALVETDMVCIRLCNNLFCINTN